MESAFIAIDWGTTNRRAYLIDNGTVIDALRDGHGILQLDSDDYPAEIAGFRSRWGNLPVLIAGMAGSNRGWSEACHIDCPVRLEDLVKAIHWIEPGVTGIVPGVRQLMGGPDVMRGEEVQFFGAVALGEIPTNAQLCQPGTHTKWALVTDGSITEFATAMTGELFSLLRTHSLLAPQLQGEVKPGAAFAEGVADSAKYGLTTSLFRIRSASLLGLRSDQEAASYASGLLIGTDVGAQIDRSVGHVYLVADAEIGDLYEQAIIQLGGTATIISSQDAFVAGITGLRSRLP